MAKQLVADGDVAGGGCLAVALLPDHVEKCEGSALSFRPTLRGYGVGTRHDDPWLHAAFQHKQKSHKNGKVEATAISAPSSKS